MEQITQAERDNAGAYLAMTRTQVINVIKGFNQERLEFKPGPQRWSIAQIVHHLAIVDGLVLGMGAKAISVGTHRESAWKDQDEELLSRVRDRKKKLQAPNIGSPSSDLSPSAVISAFEAGREELIKFIRNTEVPLRQYSLPHPVFGDLDCYQWILSLGAHAERHLKQILETIESPGVPRGRTSAETEQSSISHLVGSLAASR